MVTNVNTYIGRRVSYARKENGLTQKELGEAVGLCKQHIQKFESGEVGLVPEQIFLISRILERPIGYFFSDEEYSSTSAPSRNAIVAAKKLYEIENNDIIEIIEKIVKILSKN